jgi:cytoplasmic iron level regulating protein YaaA (DUF328/UPF0246 family)
VLVLLPPSEGKARPQSAAPVDLGALAFPQLTDQREQLLGVLERLCAGTAGRALKALGLSKGQAGDLELDAALRTAPAAPAAEVYTGVLYERLGLPELSPQARSQVLIASALWGMVRPDDRIPAYRLSMGAKLPRLGGLAAWWRPALERALPDEPGLVVDMRSGAYAAAWKPERATLLAVRAFSEDADGSRKVISHMAKRVRGDVARILLTDGAGAASPQDAADVVTSGGLRVELGAGTLDVIEPAPR